MFNPTYLLSQLQYNPRVASASLQIATSSGAMTGMFTNIRNLSALEGNAVRERQRMLTVRMEDKEAHAGRPRAYLGQGLAGKLALHHA